MIGEIEFLSRVKRAHQLEILRVINNIFLRVENLLVWLDALNDCLEHFGDIVDIIAEFHVVHFLRISVINVSTDQQVQVSLGWQ